MAGPSGSTTKYALPYPTPDDTVDVPRDIKALAEKVDLTIAPAPVGGVMMWLAAAPPTNWLLLAGQTDIPAATYPLLIPILGETGGASSMLIMPDMRQRFPVGAGTGHALKGTGGASTVTLTGRQSGKRQHNHGGASGNNSVSLAHEHAVIDFDQGGGDIAQNGGYVMVAAETNGSARAIQLTKTGAFAIGLKTNQSGALTHSHSIPNDAEAAALDPHENEPLWLAVNFIIRAK